MVMADDFDGYIDNLDLVGLDALVQKCNKKIAFLNDAGWVKLWVVAGFTNQGWFAYDDYLAAAQFLVDLAKKHSEKPIELSVFDMTYRPEEAARLVAQTKKLVNDYG